MNFDHIDIKHRERAAREFSKVERTSDGCWVWTGSRFRSGTGQLLVDTCMGMMSHTNRIAYLLHNGPFDPDLRIKHTCQNRACVNPEHLVGAEKGHVPPRTGSRRTPVHAPWAARLDDKDVREIRALYPVARIRFGKTMTCKILASKYGVSWHTIYAIIEGTIWGWLS